MMDFRLLGFCALAVLVMAAAIALVVGSMVAAILAVQSHLSLPWVIPGCLVILGFFTGLLYASMREHGC